MPERSFTTPDGVNLYGADLGPRDAAPLVLLHGGPAAHHDYLLPAFARLADTRRLFLYDQRGGGRSRAGAEHDLSFAAHLRDLAFVLDQVGALVGRPGAPIDLIGYSFGGLLAMVFAARHPDRVGKLVLASAAPPWHGYREPLDRALAAAQSSPWVAAERAALEASGMRESLPDEYRRRRFALSVAGYFADPRLAYGLTPFRVQARTAEVIRQSLAEFDFRDEVRALDGRRVVVVHGAQDPLDPSLLEDLARSIDAPFHLLAGAGHVPYLEAPEDFFSIVRAFLGGPT